MEKHNENTKQLMTLIEKNPTFKVFPMVETDVVLDDIYTHWGGHFGSPSVEEILLTEERYYIRSEDEQELIEKVLDEDEDIEFMNDAYADEYAKQKVSNYDWQKVIVVYITTPIHQ